MDFQIEHLPAQDRFQTVIDGQTARVEYRLADGVMTIVHTEVPESLGGRGIAGALVKAALDHARSEGLKVVPKCAYARSYIERHPEVADLLA